MDTFIGHIVCPECGKGSFFIEDHGTFLAVTCRSCAFRMGEIDSSWSGSYPRCSSRG